MFSHAPRLTHVCLRCQRRFARQTQLWRTSQTPAPDRPPTRFQSTAAARIDDEDDHYEPHIQTGTQKTPESSQTTRSQRGHPGSKTWRPSPTAELGMDALGKPSEIILLSQRDRDIPVVPTEPEEGVKESVHESIASEKQPLSWVQTAENINQAREQLSQQRGQLSNQQWKPVQHVLMKGFTLSQLRRFLAEGRTKPRNAKMDALIARSTRGRLAQLIATEVWGYHLPDDVAPSRWQRDNGPKESSRHYSTTKVKLPTQLIPFPQATQNPLTERLQTIAETHRVHVFRKDDYLHVRGPKDKRRAAVQAVRALAKSVTSISISSEPWLNEFQLPYWDTLDTLLEFLSVNLGVGLKRKKSRAKNKLHLTIRARYFQSPRDPTDQIRHGLRMALASSVKADAPFLKPKGPDHRHLSIVPCHPTSLSPWDKERQWRQLHERSNWDRSGSAKQQRKTSEESILKAVLQALPTETTSGDNASTPLDAQLEYSASFGRVIFHDARPGAELGRIDQFVKRMSSSRFAAEPALVPQLFSNAKFQDVLEPSSQDLMGKTPLVVRMRLCPNDFKSRAPIFELLLHGETPSLGLSQNLQIVRLSAILKETAFHVPLPSKATDIKFTRKRKCDLFDARTSIDVQCSPIFQALSAYVNEDRGGQEPPFPLFRVLPLPADLRQSHPIAARNPASPDSDASVEESAVEEEYVLESVEVLDVDSRIAPVSPGGSTRFTLEHVTCRGGQGVPDHQELVLRQSPLLAVPSQVALDLSHFVRTALGVASNISDMGRQLKHRMQATR